MLNIKGKRITILGAQKSAMALAELIVSCGADARISEQKSQQDVDSVFGDWFQKNKCEAEFGGHTRDFVLTSNLVVLSPGVPVQSEAVCWAREKGIPVLGEIEFSFQFCSVPVISVTGSNGKTTVSTLIRLCLEAAGFKIRLCGNIGDPFAANVLKLPGYDYVVLEVSSFQMESLLATGKLGCSPWQLKGFKPRVAVFTNFSQNHLDRHKDDEEYFQAKVKMFQNQSSEDWAVLNFMDKRHQALSASLKAKTVFFNQPETKSFVVNQNQQAVLKVAEALGVKANTCMRVFESFKGVEHRMEWVREIAGVQFMNDSKSTTAEATRWALNSIDKPIRLICGGRDKHIDFNVMRELIGARVKKMYLIGEARPKLRSAFDGVVGLKECDNLKDAVIAAFEDSAKGDCILLSPMCASFDMFKNFEDRGRSFKQIVNALKPETAVK